MTSARDRPRSSEQLYLLEGEFTAWTGEHKTVLRTSDSFPILTGISHTVAALSNQPAHVLVVAAPSGFARLIAAVGTLDEKEVKDMALAERICAEIGDEILDPPGTYPTHDYAEFSRHCVYLAIAQRTD